MKRFTFWVSFWFFHFFQTKRWTYHSTQALLLGAAGLLALLVSSTTLFFKPDCPLENASPYEICYQVVRPLYAFQSLLTGDLKKKNCCSQLALSDCIRSVSKIMCNPNPPQSLRKVLVRLNVSSTECATIKLVPDCINQGIPFLIILLVEGILGCYIMVYCLDLKSVMTRSGSITTFQMAMDGI